MSDRADNQPLKPQLVVLDDPDSRVVKILWSILGANRGVDIIAATSETELKKAALQAALIFIALKDDRDPNTAIPRILAEKSTLAGTILAVSNNIDLPQRLKIMAAGFDSVFNTETMETPEFKKILTNFISRGFVRVLNRVGVEEYSRFAASLAASPDAFIVVDNRKKIFFVSDHYKEAYPDNAHRLVRGMDVIDAFHMLWDAEHPTRDTSLYEDMKQFWSTLEGQREYRMPDGRICRVKARALADGQGTIVTTTDITNYKNQQIELEKQSQALSEALEKERETSALQKQFLDMISHEFRTPLSIIDGNAQVLMRRTEEQSQESVKKRAKIIRSAVSRLIGLMEGLLSSSMILSGRLQITPEPLNLKKLLTDMAAEYVDLDKQRSINCMIDDLPETVMLDRKVVTLVFGNLLSNAVKFSPDNPDIAVRCNIGNGRVMIEVEDNGIGIPEAELNRVFDLYYRTSVSGSIPGTGIGLHLVKDLVDLHGGKVFIESREGAGTKVTISLPVV